MSKLSIKLDNPLIPTSPSTITPKEEKLQKPRKNTPKKPNQSKLTHSDELWGGRLRQFGVSIPEGLLSTFSKRMNLIGVSTASGIAVAIEEFMANHNDEEIKMLAAGAKEKRAIARNNLKEQSI